MFIEYKLKGINPNGKTETIYQGIFNTDCFFAWIHKSDPLIHLVGNGFDYFSLCNEDIEAVYDGLKRALSNLESHILDLGYIRPLSLM